MAVGSEPQPVGDEFDQRTIVGDENDRALVIVERVLQRDGGRYTVSLLQQMKTGHERRIEVAIEQLRRKKAAMSCSTARTSAITVRRSTMLKRLQHFFRIATRLPTAPSN